MSTTPAFDLFAACQPGLEPLLAAELERLALPKRALAGGVAFRGGIAEVMRACLWLGTASHVRIRLGQFRCRALGELQRKAAELPWREWLRRDVPVELHATTRASRIYHTGAAEERLTNAIDLAFGRTPGQRPPAAGDGDAVAQVQARFVDDVCTLSLDATTTPLHRRGYRLDGRKAPLREDLAHALLLAADRQPDEALLDPFCGSGTIAIEAAGLMLGFAPGRLRPPPLQHLALFDADVWQRVRTADTPMPKPAPETERAPIAASDRDAGAIEAACANAERAGVRHAIDFRHAALSSQPWLGAGDRPTAGGDHAGDGPAAGTLPRPARGVVVSNPPFGQRVGQKDRLLPLYQTLGNRLQSLAPGWRAVLLAHDVRLARRSGLAMRAAFTTRHGGLSVTAMVTTAAADAMTG